MNLVLELTNFDILSTKDKNVLLIVLGLWSLHL